MTEAYNNLPEYKQVPLSRQERMLAHGAFIATAGITVDCELRPNGMHVIRNRIETEDFFDEVAMRSGLSAALARKAVTELKILKLVDYSNVYTAVVSPQAIIYSGDYMEPNVQNVFRFSPAGKHQYYFADK